MGPLLFKTLIVGHHLSFTQIVPPLPRTLGAISAEEICTLPPSTFGIGSSISLSLSKTASSDHV
jgi:hypothetical protein